jgi:hypothetical protein
MRIELWSRKEGHVKPPEQLVHAEPESHVFPETFRTRIKQWSLESASGLMSYSPMGDVVNDSRDTMQMLFRALCEAYGRDLLVEPEAFGPAGSAGHRYAERQIPVHLQRCSDAEVMDYIDAVFQITGYVANRSGDGASAYALEIAEPLNRIFSEEGVGYRWHGRTPRALRRRGHPRAGDDARARGARVRTLRRGRR